MTEYPRSRIVVYSCSLHSSLAVCLLTEASADISDTLTVDLKHTDSDNFDTGN